MGEIATITPPALSLAELAERNRGIHPDILTVFMDALALYREAADNIRRNGSVSGNPKTGAPMVNPYLSILDSSAKTICKFHRDFPSFNSGDKKPASEWDGINIEITATTE